MLNHNVRQGNLNYLTIFEGTTAIELDAVAKEWSGRMNEKACLAKLEDNLIKKYDMITIDQNRQGLWLDKRFQPIG
jgi:hypothetical protein